MKRVLVALVSVGALGFSVYVAKPGTVQEQVDFLADAGFAPPNRDCTCPVRLDPDFAAGAGLKQYQRLTFPCVLTVLADAGRDVQMPPMPLQKTRDSIDVVDWADCSMAASTSPVRAKWGTSQPFTVVAAGSRPWCRQKSDAGLPCLMKLWDGGAATYGDRNVSPCASRATPATCQRVSGQGVYLGDDEEDL